MATPDSARRRPAQRARRVRSTTATWGALNEGDLVVVDSAPLIYILDGHAEFASAFEGLFECHAANTLRIAISTIAMAEVLAGPFRHGQDVLARRFEKAMESFDIVPVTPPIAVTAARVRAGSGLRLPDALQAATAIEIGAAALVTHDRDFSRLAGLRVIMGPEG